MLKMTKVRDTLGRTIQVDDYLLGQNNGNRNVEYGLILFRVLALDPTNNAVNAIKISSRIDNGKFCPALWKVTLRRMSKYVIVTPPDNMKMLFESVVNNEDADFTLLRKWLEGESVWEND